MIIIDNNTGFLGVLGKIYENENYTIQFSSWSDVLNQISYKAVRKSDDSIFLESMSTKDINRLKELFLNIYSFELVFEDGSKFYQETITKAQGLIQAGFSKLIREEDNYTVDGVFPQNFLTEEELTYLLSEGIEETLLSDIK